MSCTCLASKLAASIWQKKCYRLFHQPTMYDSDLTWQHFDIMMWQDRIQYLIWYYLLISFVFVCDMTSYVQYLLSDARLLVWYGRVNINTRLSIWPDAIWPELMLQTENCGQHNLWGTRYQLSTWTSHTHTSHTYINDLKISEIVVAWHHMF